MIIILVILIVLIAAVIIWILSLHSLELPSLKLSDLKKAGIKNILFIYPHPDDEIMISGGLITQIANDTEFNINVVDITKGDKGNELLKLPPEELGKIREQEYYKALKTLSVKNPEIWDIPDGEVLAHYDLLKEKIAEYISVKNIDLIVTFERWGIYGHQDHVALSKAVYEIGEENKNLRIFYSTIAPKISKMLNLKQYIKDLELEKFEQNELPEFKLPIFLQLFTQYKAVRNYKSQNLSHKYPLWVTILMNPYEYYTSKYKQV